MRNSRETWQRRIDRAVHLAEDVEAARSLLRTYAALLGVQRDCAEAWKALRTPLSGSMEHDRHVLRPDAWSALRAVAAIASPPIAEEAQRVVNAGDAALDALLLEGWRQPSGHAFLPKLVLQPYAEQLAASGVHPVDRDASRGGGHCPFCGGAPQLAILDSAGDADGGGRRLQCALCFTTWPFRRVLCASCGEEDERRLGYFQSPAFPHVRVDACETCRQYVKTIDLTRLGLAVPLVDEVAAGALDLWASEHDYQKIELNLAGM